MSKNAHQAEYQWISDAKRLIDHEIARELEQKDAPGRRAALTFDQVMRANMGKFMPPRAWVKNRKDGDRLLEQTEAMAEALGRQGIVARRESNIQRIDDVTGEITDIPSFRNICFLPVVAKRNRRDQILDIEYYLSQIDPHNWRYVVITFGDRIDAFGDLKEAKRNASRKIARWRERVLKKLGVKTGFVGWEYPRNDDGSYHLHANVLIKTPFFADRGAALRSKTHEHFGSWWKDCGKINNVSELVKYPFKPNSIDGANDAELAWLHGQTFGERICNILGPIQKWRKHRKESGLKVFKMRQELRLRFVCRISAEDNCFDDDPTERADVGSGGENVIVGREAPSFRNGLWATSGTLVWNYNPQPDQKALKSRRRLDAMHGYWADARADYVASGAPDVAVARQMRDAALAAENGDTNLRALWVAGGDQYIVHNDTITSRTDDAESLIEEWFDPPPPPDNVIQLHPGA